MTQFETIAHSAESEFVHKKVVEGGGEFAVVRLRLEPLERGSGIVFVSGSSPLRKEFASAVETSVRTCAKKGGYSGNPVADIRVTLLDGKFHEMDSNERTFAIAAEGAFYDALHKGHPKLIS